MTDIFNKLIREKLTPNSFYVLHCISTKIKPIDFVNSSLEINRLKQNGWLKENFELTDKSIIFITEINGFFKKAKKKTSQDLMGNDFLTNIVTYNHIFPNIKLSSGNYARVNPKNLESAFRWFFDNFSYDWETVFKATKRYVTEYGLNNYDYMRDSQYFIRKQSSDKSFNSDLATYCEVALTKTNDDLQRFKERFG
jgi:hypothetical protein